MSLKLWSNYKTPMIALSITALSALTAYRLYSSLKLPTGQENSKRNDELETILAFENALAESIQTIHNSDTSDGHFDEILNSVVEAIKKLLKTQRVNLLVTSSSWSKYYVGKTINIDVEKDPSRGIAQLSYDNQKVVEISDCENIPRFSVFVGDTAENSSAVILMKNIVCVPIVIEGKSFGVVYAADINTTLFGNEQSPIQSATAIIELLVDNACIAIQKSLVLRKSILLNIRSEALLSILRMRSSGKPLNTLLQNAIEVVDNAIHPKFVSVYLCDQTRKEIFVCASKDGLEGLTISYGQGVAGYVAETMETIRIDDAYSDPRFLPTVDKFTGSVTQSIMCVPVPGFSTSSPIALIQVINKSRGYFDEDDEETLTVISQELSIGLRLRARELYALKTQSQKSLESVSLSILEESLLQDYGSIAHRYKYRVIGDKIIQGTMSPLETPNVQKSSSFASSDAEAMVGRHTIAEASEAVNTYSYDPFIQSDDELIDLAVHMLRSYNLIDALHIDISKLHRFMVTIHSLYHPNNDFHNFKHGWSVMHLTYQILRGGADQYLNNLDMAALLIAALCHDVDHTGYSNNFEIASRSPLAMLYCDDTVLERHHAATTNRILSSDDFDFLPSLSLNDKKVFRKVVTSAIFATDMGKHFNMVEQLVSRTTQKPPFDKSDADSRLELVRYAIHCADIGAQTQCRDLAQKWTDKCISEFSHQADKEVELGLEPTPYMIGLNDELKRMQLQQGFISGIVLPLWSSLVECLPNLAPSVERLVQNRQFYADRVDQILIARAAETPLP